VLAYSIPKRNFIVMGPQVNSDNFDGVFGHELMHVEVHQHYKGAIPGWLEEGLANHVGKFETPDYKWLASQPVVPVSEMNHRPFSGDGPSPRYHYMASTALMEMIAAKCSLKELLRLSVGDKLEEWLDSYCHIQNVDEEFKKWIAKKNSGAH
jgi:hypothetical protein